MSEPEVSIELSNLIQKMKNKWYDVQLDKLELDGQYLYFYGKVYDKELKKTFDFDDYIDLSDYCIEDEED